MKRTIFQAILCVAAAAAIGGCNSAVKPGITDTSATVQPSTPQATIAGDTSAVVATSETQTATASSAPETAETTPAQPGITTKEPAVPPVVVSSRYQLLPGQKVYMGGYTGTNPPPVSSHPEYQFEECSSCHYPGGVGAVRLVEPEHCCSECHMRDPRLAWFHPHPDDYSCPMCHTAAG